MNRCGGKKRPFRYIFAVGIFLVLVKIPNKMSSSVDSNLEVWYVSVMQGSTGKLRTLPDWVASPEEDKSLDLPPPPRIQSWQMKVSVEMPYKKCHNPSGDWYWVGVDLIIMVIEATPWKQYFSSCIISPRRKNEKTTRDILRISGFGNLSGPLGVNLPWLAWAATKTKLLWHSMKYWLVNDRTLAMASLL